MKIYSLYYYDRPFLTAWLSHYCQLKCIDEIVIQDQNWSRDDSVFLRDVVATYTQEHRKKIVVLPSPFKHIHGENKRMQFIHYGQPVIRNRVIERFKTDSWITSAMDEAIYGDSYEDTEKKLEEFEKLAEARAESKEKKSTVGYLPLYSVFKEGIFPSGFEFGKAGNPVWKHRILKFTVPFKHRGGKVHDCSLDVFINEKWVRATSVAGITRESDILDAYGFGVPVPLKILHYHTLLRPSLNSSAIIHVSLKNIKNPEQHPQAYLNRLIINPWR